MSSIRHLLLRSKAFWLIVLLGLCFQSALAADAPTVTLSFDFPGSEPEHFVFSVAADGKSSYDSNGRLTPQSDTGEPFHLDFTMSKPTSDRIFALAKNAHYFERELDSKKANLAFTGKKVLSYAEGARKNEQTYNYSMIPAIQQLTSLFQNLSMTLEFGRRLEYYHHYQKLALHDELKRVEEQAQQNNLVELAAIGSILHSIANDNSVINVDRARALRLLNQPPNGGSTR